MWRDYFEVNGAKYYTGTVFIVKHTEKNAKAVFLYYDTEGARYCYRIKECVYNVDFEKFHRIFVAVTNEVCEQIHLPSVNKRKDFEIHNLFIGWVWYVFLMAVSIIFKDVVALWILISIIFFTWRFKKIKEEGKYIEW